MAKFKGTKRGFYTENKKKTELKHAIKRARQRFGLELKEHHIFEIVKMIQRGEGVYLHKQSDRISHWILNYSGRDMIAVYDKNRGMVVTFLTLEMYDPARYTFCNSSRLDIAFKIDFFKKMGKKWA